MNAFASPSVEPCAEAAGAARPRGSAVPGHVGGIKAGTNRSAAPPLSTEKPLKGKPCDLPPPPGPARSCAAMPRHGTREPFCASKRLPASSGDERSPRQNPRAADQTPIICSGRTRGFLFPWRGEEGLPSTAVASCLLHPYGKAAGAAVGTCRAGEPNAGGHRSRPPRGRDLSSTNSCKCLQGFL